MVSALDELIGRLDTMPHEQRVVITEDAIAATSGMKWIPNPGPQTEAYFCQADVLLYGGQAAGGKSDLLCGLALVEEPEPPVVPTEPPLAPGDPKRPDRAVRGPMRF